MTAPERAEEVRHCIKCGAEVGFEETLCRSCNRAGMLTPSATQYHATVAAAIVIGVVVLAVAASLSLRGVGPYAATVSGVAPGEPQGYAISYAVTNEGTNPGRAKCLIVTLGASGERLRTANTLTTQIPGGDTVSLTETIPGLLTQPSEVQVSCD
ncbi:MAG: hypothetical protein ACRDGD_01010 [Candidatus Limnocylindria bacterium]